MDLSMVTVKATLSLCLGNWIKSSQFFKLKNKHYSGRALKKEAAGQIKVGCKQWHPAYSGSLSILVTCCAMKAHLCSVKPSHPLYLDLESTRGGLKTGPQVKHHTWQKKEEHSVLNDKNEPKWGMNFTIQTKGGTSWKNKYKQGIHLQSLNPYFIYNNVEKI